MTRLRRCVLLTLFLLPGCFPIDVAVNKQGEVLIPRQEGFFLHNWRSGKTTPVPWKAEGLPVHARFAPGEAEVLLVSVAKKEFAKEYRLEMMPVKGGASRTIYKTRQNVGCAAISPNGKRLAVVQHADIFQDHMPEIVVVDIASGKSSLLAEKTGPFAHWLPDSAALFTLRIDEKVQNTQHYLGQLGLLNATDGSFTAIAKVLGDKRCFLAVSPDLKYALFTAIAADGAEAKLDPKAAAVRSLFELDINTKSIRKVTGLDRTIEFARYSPDGKQVLLVAEPTNALLSERRDLLVADARLQSPKVIAKNAYGSLVRFSTEDMNMPGWLDEKTVYYFAKVHVYGTTGQAIHLRVVNADGSDNRDLQPALDLAIDALTARER